MDENVNGCLYLLEEAEMMKCVRGRHRRKKKPRKLQQIKGAVELLGSGDLLEEVAKGQEERKRGWPRL